MDIGKSILKASTRTSEDGSAALGDAKKAQESVVWLQRAFTLMEKMEDSENAGVLELRVGILLLSLRSRLTLWPKRAILRSLGMCFTVRFELLRLINFKSARTIFPRQLKPRTLFVPRRLSRNLLVPLTTPRTVYLFALSSSDLFGYSYL